jgi:hypothetical protein
MNRLIIASAVAVAAAAVSVPAVAGLSNNPSFSHRLPVHVPSQAKVVQLDDHGKVVDASVRSGHPASTTVTSPTRSREPEPAGDHGSSTGQSAEPGDDRGQTTEPADDSGGHGGGGTSTGGTGRGSSSGHGG